MAIALTMMTLAACDPPQTPQQQAVIEQAIPMPDDERQYIDAIRSADATAKAQDAATGNGFRHDAIREEQDKAL
jgi:hypothetical protein